ncbi:MAG: hypothetical protein Roseis2KO_56240 [Roseivirga sp.]
MIKMKLLRKIVFLIIAFGGLHQNSLAQDPCHFHNLKKETTALGRTIDYRKVNDSIYHIYYGQAESLRKVPGDFYCDAPVLTKPYVEAENDDFLFLSHRCGTACRIGHVLPLDPGLEIKILPHWLTYDLDKNLIVSMDYDFEHKSMHIKLMDLTSYEEKDYDTGVSCDYGIPIDCFKQVEIEEDKVVVTWEKDIKAPPYEIAFGK